MLDVILSAPRKETHILARFGISTKSQSALRTRLNCWIPTCMALWRPRKTEQEKGKVTFLFLVLLFSLFLPILSSVVQALPCQFFDYLKRMVTAGSWWNRHNLHRIKSWSAHGGLPCIVSGQADPSDYYSFLVSTPSPDGMFFPDLSSSVRI